MKNFLLNKVTYYTQFAEVMQKKFMQLRYGIKTCSFDFDMQLAMIRKEITDWQQNNDAGIELTFRVDAGASQNITLPQTTLTLTATVFPATSIVSSTLWTQLSGPSTAIIVSPTEITSTVEGLIEGMYVFQVKVDNVMGISATATTTKSVLYINPTANAGPDKTFTIPNDSGTLSGIDIPGSYAIASYTWTKISGSSVGSINDNGQYSDLIVGTYVFRKTVTDINGRSSYDDMSLTMIAAAATVYYGWSSTDPYLDLKAGVPFTFQKSIGIENDQDFVLDFHDMPAFSYPVIQVPAGQEVKNYYSDSGSDFNKDFIPGDHFRATFVVSGKRYYTTYGTESFSSGLNDRITIKKI